MLERVDALVRCPPPSPVLGRPGYRRCGIPGRSRLSGRPGYGRCGIPGRWRLSGRPGYRRCGIPGRAGPSDPGARPAPRARRVPQPGREGPSPLVASGVPSVWHPWRLEGAERATGRASGTRRRSRVPSARMPPASWASGIRGGAGQLRAQPLLVDLHRRGLLHPEQEPRRSSCSRRPGYRRCAIPGRARAFGCPGYERCGIPGPSADFSSPGLPKVRHTGPGEPADMGWRRGVGAPT
jgi:hypothetical protein